MTIFQKKVYQIVSKIPRGQVFSYGQIAEKLGNKNLARAVGNALNKNYDRNIPCHRVIKSNGQLGGFNRGIKKKALLLKKEGVRIKP